MIKFFRRIRQQMLTENKFSTYLLYAIGEIILVVIGILIALQINNANEERKTNKQLNGYLHSISKNIQSDTVKIIEIKHLRIRHNQTAKAYMNCIMTDSMPVDLIGRMTFVFGEQYLNVNPSGFDALKNSGYIANLQGSILEDAIYDYYAFFEEIHESETSLNNFIESMEVGLFNEDYEQISRFFKMGLASNSKEDVQRTLKLIYHNSKILGIMQRVADEHYFYVYDSLRTKGQRIVSLIEKKLVDD